jgi:hypothetical protein
LADEIEGAFPELADSLATKFKTIEESLNTLVSEYEANRPRFYGAPLSMSVNSLPRLDRFLEHPIKKGRTASKVEIPPGFAVVHNEFRAAQHVAWERYHGNPTEPGSLSRGPRRPRRTPQRAPDHAPGGR